MRSRTKRRMSGEEIRDLAREVLGPETEVSGHEEFTDGWFCSVYGLDLADGRRLVLKLAPEPGLTLMRYESDLMRTEIEFYRRTTAAGVPMPAVHVADPERGFLLMERLAGPSLAAVGSTLTEARLEALHRELGRIARRIGSVTGSRFGYPRRSGRTQSGSWHASFLAFVDDVLADAADFDAELPAPSERIRGLIARKADLLHEVTTPALVHFDLYGGNVFLVPAGSVAGAGRSGAQEAGSDGDSAGAGRNGKGDAGEGGAQGIGLVEGIIDGERAFYGDPIAELVGLAAFREPGDVPGLLDGFLGRALTWSERVRLRLYTIYMLLIVATEGVSRGFDPEEHEPIRRFALERLEAELAAL